MEIRDTAVNFGAAALTILAAAATLGPGLADPIAPTALPASIPDGVYALRPKFAMGQLLDLDSANRVKAFNGQKVQTWEQSGLPQQTWTITRIKGNSYKIRPANALNMAVEVSTAKTSTGIKVDISQDVGTPNQQWIATEQNEGIAFAPVSAPSQRMTSERPGNGSQIQAQDAITGLGPPQSQIWMLTKIEAPQIPTRVMAESDNSAVVVHWDNQPNAMNYDVFRGVSPHREGATAVARVGRALYVDFDVARGTSYYYRVRAINPAGVSGLSTEARCVPVREVKPLRYLADRRSSEDLNLGPNIMADASFESWEWRCFKLSSPAPYQAASGRCPFVMIKPTDAHTGDIVVRAELRRSGRSFYQPLGVWNDAAYVSSVWVKGRGSGTLFVATADLSQRIASKTVTARSDWRKVSLTWNTGNLAAKGIVVGFADDVSRSGAMEIDDFYTGLKNGHTMAFTAPPPNTPHPEPPAGFSLIFDDEFNNTSTIDMNNTRKPGYKWYLDDYHPNYGARSSINKMVAENGVLTIYDTVTWNGGSMATTCPARNKEHYIGTTFTGGKGIYFEASFANPILPEAHGCFWGITPGTDGWLEDDYVEFEPWWGPYPVASYSSATSMNLPSYNNYTTFVPALTDFTNYHTYGMLWVPASAENGWTGYRQAFFDGVAQQSLCWITGKQDVGRNEFQTQQGKPDCWLNLILGCDDHHGDPVMKIDYVRVYAVDPKASMKVIASE